MDDPFTALNADGVPIRLDGLGREHLAGDDCMGANYASGGRVVARIQGSGGVDRHALTAGDLRTRARPSPKRLGRHFAASCLRDVYHLWPMHPEAG